jgi:S-adenosylmethionine:tRNA ribosyltransferase-isomerase
VTLASATQFTLPEELQAYEPPEARGVARDGVRLLVASSGGVRRRHFSDLPSALRPGDLLVVNTSATLPASVDGHRADGRLVTAHFAHPAREGSWLVELRPRRRPTGPVNDARVGERIELPDGVGLILLEPQTRTRDGAIRLWRADVGVEGPVPDYLARVGRPISYGYVPRRWPLADYQTVFARHPGSAEMPSAGRPFTSELVITLISRGVTVAPIILHTGVSSLEEGEPPIAERYAVPAATADLVNLARDRGGRVIAVGTTVTRAVETVARADGWVGPGAGWTDLVLGPDRPARVVTGLITGWHAPGASHLLLLEAVVGAEVVAAAYREALRARFLWHEFGDSALLLADGS